MEGDCDGSPMVPSERNNNWIWLTLGVAQHDFTHGQLGHEAATSYKANNVWLMRLSLLSLLSEGGWLLEAFGIIGLNFVLALQVDLCKPERKLHAKKLID